ncbi:MAG: RDD family protein [Bacteroidota bacterium]
MTRTSSSFSLIDSKTRFRQNYFDGLIISAISLMYLFTMEQHYGSVEDWGYVQILGLLGIYILYFLFFELTVGKSPGQFLNQTTIVNNKGQPARIKQILIRSLCRLNPLFGIPFFQHKRSVLERMSHTYLVNENSLSPLSNGD